MNEGKRMERINAVFPEYYRAFYCKCGECRHVCCRDWTISLSEAEYFRLVGMNCPKKLRHKLDCAFHGADSPSRERYMLISPDYRGDCPMLDEDGLCMLQKTCGEEVLPLVCRLYPRAIKNGEPHEACISTSCEKAVELLIENTEPLNFVNDSISSIYKGIPTTLDTEEKLCLNRHCIELLKDRSHTLKERIHTIGTELSGTATMSLNASFSEGLKLFKSFIISLERISKSINECGSRALEFLGIAEEIGDFSVAEKRYAEAEKHLREAFPDIEIYAEKLLINHVFYMQFPYTDSRRSLTDSFTSFAVACALMKLLIVCDLNESNNIDDFIDVNTMLFRFFEHSNFYSLNLSHILKREEDLISLAEAII